MSSLTKDILVQSLSAVIWGRMNIPNALQFASNIEKSSGGIFNGTPQMLDLPEDADDDIPFLQMKSDEEKFIFQVSRDRVDLTVQENDQEGMLPDGESGRQMDMLLVKLLPEIETVTNTFNNLAYVGRYIVEREHSVRYLYEKYLKPNNMFARSHILELNAMEQSSLAGISTNEWIRLHTARRIEDDFDGAIGIEIDINTMANDNLEAGGPQVGDFFNAMSNHIHEKMNDYLL